MQLFFDPYVLQNQCLNEEESHHALKVLRKKRGEVIQIIDGQGYLYSAQILEEKDRKCKVKILESDFFENHNAPLDLYVCPTKNMDRIEWMVEKCVEIGLRSIHFFEVKNSDRKEMKLNRIERILVSAIKQSKQYYLPEVYEMVKFKDIFTKIDPTSLKLMAYVDHSQSKTISDFTFNKPVSMLIGPEGDFAPFEVEMAIKNGFESISLGKNVLRTETAGMFVTSVIAQKFNQK